MILSVHLWHVFSCNIYCKFYFTTLSCYYNSFGIYFSLNTYFQYSFAALSVAAKQKERPPAFLREVSLFTAWFRRLHQLLRDVLGGNVGAVGELGPVLGDGHNLNLVAAVQLASLRIGGAGALADVQGTAGDVVGGGGVDSAVVVVMVGFPTPRMRTVSPIAFTSPSYWRLQSSANTSLRSNSRSIAFAQILGTKFA